MTHNYGENIYKAENEAHHYTLFCYFKFQYSVNGNPFLYKLNCSGFLIVSVLV